MNKIYFLLFLLFILIIPIKTRAYYDVIDSRCTNSIKLDLKEKAEDVNYRLSRNSDDSTYTLTIYNLPSDLIIKDNSGNEIKDTKIVKAGTKLILTMYASKNNYCAGYKAGSKLVSAPYYNKYSKNDLCIGYEDYYLCSENSNLNMTEEEFKTKMNTYIKSIKEKEKQEVVEIEEKKFDIIDFFKDYGIYILGGISIIAVIVVASIIENKRKNKDIL